MKHCIIPPSALPRPHMKGSLCFPEMLDNSDSPRVLTNSIMGHFESISAPFFFLPPPPPCVQPVELPDSFDVNTRCFISDERSRVPSD